MPTGASNTASFLALLHKLGIESETTQDPNAVLTAAHIVVPGVGTFGSVMATLRSKPGLVEALQERLRARKPTLLVCAGLQILASTSEESPDVAGLNIVPMNVTRFASHLTVPQQAWSEVKPVGHSLFVKQGFAFYANSFCMEATPFGWAVARSVLGHTSYVAAMQSGGVLALQFHPELSGAYGADAVGRWFRGSSAAVPVPKHELLAPRSLCRIITCLDVKDGRVVKGVKFQNLADAGDPAALAEEYERQGSDELVILDVSATIEGRSNAVEVVRSCRARCSLPITVGGGVRTLDDASALLAAGADKVAVNSAAVSNPGLLTSLAHKFGAQCVVLAIDGKRNAASGGYNVMTRSGALDTGLDVVKWAVEGAQLGAGEILLTSLDRDGTRQGFDCDLIKLVAAAVRIPVVASGGANCAQHMVDAFGSGASAVLAASIFHFGDTTVAKIKEEVAALGVRVRPAPKQRAQSLTYTQNIQSVIPCIDIMNGNAVQLVGGKPEALEIDAGDPMAILRKYRVGGEIAIVDLDAAISGGTKNNSIIIEKLLREASCRVGGGIRTVDSARKWLNMGASKVVIGSAATKEFLAELPRERVVVALDCLDGEVVIHGWKTKTGVQAVDRMKELLPYAGHFLVTFVEREGKMQGFPLDRVEKMVQILDGKCQLTIAGGVTTEQDVMELDKLGVEAQVGMAMYSGRLPLASAMWSVAVPDAYGLVTTVVVDEQDCALGVCFSNRESFQRAVSERRGIYWSRSRQSLWIKGETSGNTQELLHVSFDCDRDALKFVVRQQGSGFCHRDSSFSCFGNRRGVSALQDTIMRRMVEGDESSYTNRLFNDAALLSAKVIEEAHELVDATTPEHVAEELADLFYFSMVKAAKHGVRLADLDAVLDRRALKITRRKGDAKEQYAKEIAAKSAPPAAVAASPLLAQPTSDVLLARVKASEVSGTTILKPAVDPAALADATPVVEDVRQRGLPALLQHSIRLGDCKDAHSKIVFSKDDMKAAFDSLDASQQELLQRVAERIRLFALHQKNSIKSTRFSIPGGVAGQNLCVMQRAGIYAPGGRYPLPSSILMGAVTAKVAGVPSVVCASPRPQPIVLAACHVAGADSLLAIGGAQAIAALAYGIPQLPEFAQGCDVVTGPGNKWVTAAKYLVAGSVAIDMLAGPSECLVCCDPESDAQIVAADLLAQAEHDVAARPILVVIGSEANAETFIRKVEAQMKDQLLVLSTRDVALEACQRNGIAVVGVTTADQARVVLDTFAGEHVELIGKVAESLQNRLRNYGALFIGSMSAEVFGDYGAGPNHTLPTGGTARSFSGLSVHTFFKKSTFLNIQSGNLQLINDSVAMGVMEGLHGHAAAARLRLDRMQQRGPEHPLFASHKVKLALPKGRMMDNLLELLEEAGMKVALRGRELRPKIECFPDWDLKLLKPRNVVEALEHGMRNIGFVGTDLLEELGASNVVPVFDTGMDKVRIVAAFPEALLGPDNVLPDRHLIIATEYANISSRWISAQGLDAEILSVSGSTEVFPPDDADGIIDNTSTGTTLKANRLNIVGEIFQSSTHLCVHRSVLDDPILKLQVDNVIMLLKSALEAKDKVIFEFNIGPDSLDAIIKDLPSMKKPTINQLHNNSGYAIKIVIDRNMVSTLIPKVKNEGGTDILVSALKQVLR